MAASLTVGERIIFHLSQYTKYHDSFDVPIDISQDGIAAALRISRAHAALELKKLKDSKEVAEKLSHIKRGRTKRKVYFLTANGEQKAREIKDYARENEIDLTPFQDIRKCKGPELWKTLDEKFKPVVAMSCVFRKPFRREVLPDIATSLLPVDERGNVDLPQELKEYVISVTNPEKLKDYHDFAADYWLHWDDLKEVLYHLVCGKRFADAEILVFHHYKELLLAPDVELLEAVSNIRDVTRGYSGIVHYVQAETARLIGMYEYSLIVTKLMESSSIPSERFEGYNIEGHLHLDRKDYQNAYKAFIRARGVFDELVNIPLECDIAESLIRDGDYHEPMEILKTLFKHGFENPEDEARAYHLMGQIALETGDDHEALRMFTLSRNAMRNKQTELYNKISEMYYHNGQRDKSLEYALKANAIKLTGTF
jgi:tetratricopeptide (TPR) repeat protein